MPTKHNTAPVEGIDLAEAARQIAEKAVRERTVIEAQVQQAQQIYASAQEQRAQLESARQERAVRIANLEQIAVTLHQQHQAALSYAKMAQGTLGEHKAIADALAAQASATQHQAIVEQERASARDLDVPAAEQIAELDTIIADRQAILNAAPPRLREIAQVETQALRELGQAEYARFVEECAPYDDRLDRLREELTTVQMERHAYLTKEYARFAPWAEHQSEVLKKLPPPDNATLRIMRAALAYMDQLLADRMQLAHTLPESRTAQHVFYNYTSWWSALAVGRDVLYVERSIQSPSIPEFQRNRELLAQILSEYEATTSRRNR